MFRLIFDVNGGNKSEIMTGGDAPQPKNCVKRKNTERKSAVLKILSSVSNSKQFFAR